MEAIAFLSRAMQQHPGESFVLAIAAAESLAHLPWEVLHDGNTFLVARMPAVVPVRWVSSDTKKLSVEGEPEIGRCKSYLWQLLPWG
jgi:hypothetical protein